MTPKTKPRSILWMIAHDEWCSHDETDDGIPCDCHLSVIATLRARLEQMERALADRDRRIDEGDAIPASFYKRLEAAEKALEDIVRWSEAYPLDIFPEPDFKKVRRLLEAGGITLDAVSASNMRHVVTEVGKMARAALAHDKGKDADPGPEAIGE